MKPPSEWLRRRDHGDRRLPGRPSAYSHQPAETSSLGDRRRSSCARARAARARRDAIPRCPPPPWMTRTSPRRTRLPAQEPSRGAVAPDSGIPTSLPRDLKRGSSTLAAHDRGACRSSTLHRRGSARDGRRALPSASSSGWRSSSPSRSASSGAACTGRSASGGRAHAVGVRHRIGDQSRRLRANRNFAFLRTAQQVLILVAPAAGMIMLGGLGRSNSVILGRCSAPLEAVAFDRPGRAWPWFGAFVAAILLALALSEVVRPNGGRPARGLRPDSSTSSTSSSSRSSRCSCS